MEFLHNMFLVLPQLLGKAVGTVELAVVSHPAYKLHLDMLVIEVALEANDVNLQGEP